MSLRLKLFLTYLVMGLIPILLLIAIAVGVIVQIVNNSPFLTSLDQGQHKILQGINDLLNLELLTRDNPNDLFNKEMLSRADETLSAFHVGIILVDENMNVFFASSFLDEQAMMQDIRTAESKDRRFKFHDASMSDLGYQMLDTESDFSIVSKKLVSMGTLYVAIETGPAKQISSTYFRRFLSILFWGLLGLILLMTFLVTRSMMQSLKKLKDGVRHITEGDLNFSIKSTKRDEVGEVIMAFEEMRLRLKGSIEAQVKEDENRKELVANISHDLKTPVTAIKGYVEGLMDGVADTPEKRFKYLSTILGKTIALDRMIDDLFLYSSLDIGRTVYHFETVSAGEFFESLCSETKLDLCERGFDVTCDLQMRPDAWVRVDQQMIRRLQHNLTENAAKYCKSEDRKVTFSAVIQGNEIVCSTRDNGIGIQAEELSRIFERFYRADAARTSTIGGTGLGLQISRKIIEDHGGRIWAESEFGAYTRISWTLPVIRDNEDGGTSHA